MTDGGDDLQQALREVLPLLTGDHDGSGEIGESVGVQQHQLGGPLQNVCVHMGTWMFWAGTGGEVVKLTREFLDSRAERAVLSNRLDSVSSVEGYEVPFKHPEQLGWQGVAEANMHDGEDWEEKVRGHKDPRYLPHQNAIKGLGDNETSVKIASLEETVYASFVPSL